MKKIQYEQNAAHGFGRRSFLLGIGAAGVGAAGSYLLPGHVEAQAASSSNQQTTAPPNLWTWGPFESSNRLGKYFKIDYKASSVAEDFPLDVTYAFWFPDGVERVRGVIVHQHGASILAAQAGATAVFDLHWQAFAKKWDCILLGPSYRVLNDAIDLRPGAAGLWLDPRRGSNATFLRALKDVSAQSGHPEIESAPWVLWGHSAGGIWSNVMSMLHPERVAAVFLRSGTANMFRVGRPEFPQPSVPPAVYAIPTMTNAGVLENKANPWSGSISTFQEYRAQGAPIGFAPDPRTSHFCGDSRYFAIPFLESCLAMRLPEKGSTDKALKPVDITSAWLALFMGDTAVPAAEFKGDKTKAVWLPNEAVAKAWMQYVKSGTVSSISTPPAPFNVKVSAGVSGNEITWDAEADLDSGMGGFVILRDGRGVARLPERPPDRVFGRPLFQGMSYHDTPEAPYPQMTYTDKSGSGAKHTYSVIALSSAGVGSQTSETVSIG